MWKILIALGAGLAALAVAKDAETPAVGADGKPVAKPKRGPRTEAEIFADGEKAGRTKRDAELAAEAAEERRIDKLVKRRMRMAEAGVEDEPAPRATKSKAPDQGGKEPVH